MLDELKPSSAAGPKANLELRRSSTAEPCSTLPIPILSEVGPGSAQHQIGQRDHGRRSADQDQGVVGSEVVLHVEEPLDFLGHEQRLGRGEQDLCEPPHIRRVFFPAMQEPDVSAIVANVGRQAETMAQRLQSWRSGKQQRQWLVCLIATMEQVSRPEIRRRPCDRRVLAAFQTQLGRPAFGHPAGTSPFSLRN